MNHWLYTEYNDEDPFDERETLLFPTKYSACTHLKHRVEEYFGKSWASLKAEWKEWEPMEETHVSYDHGNGVKFFEVEEIEEENVEPLPKLYCFVGRSRTGKDTILSEVEKGTGLKKLVSFTDAPIRDDQKDGREHWFMTKENFAKLMLRPDVLAYTEVHGYHYMGLMSQIDHRTKLYIVDPAGIADLRARFGDRFDITVFYIQVSEDVKKTRETADRGPGFDYKARCAAEDAQFAEFEKTGDYILIKNDGNVQEAAREIMKIIKEEEEKR